MKTLRVERAVTIDAPPDRIYPHMIDFHRWSAWSPYEKRDPKMEKRYSGPTSGTGSVYEWKGNSQVGQGRMEITECSQPSRITIDLHFIKPFEGHNVATFALTPVGSGTNVAWTMEGQLAFIPRVMSLFIDMDKMIGKDFETGLANLKTVAEKT